jgi:hypothetical protein
MSQLGRTIGDPPAAGKSGYSQRCQRPVPLAARIRAARKARAVRCSLPRPEDCSPEAWTAYLRSEWDAGKHTLAGQLEALEPGQERKCQTGRTQMESIMRCDDGRFSYSCWSFASGEMTLEEVIAM